MKNPGTGDLGKFRDLKLQIPAQGTLANFAILNHVSPESGSKSQKGGTLKKRRGGGEKNSTNLVKMIYVFSFLNFKFVYGAEK